jgi:fatty acid desaturase
MFNGFRNKASILPNLLAFSFTFLAYGFGVFMLFSQYWFMNVAGVFFTAQALIISAYLLHEFSHWSIFKTPALNRRWGIIMSWINGSCYSTFEEIRSKHMHHHVDRADILTFNVQHLMRDMPAFARNSIMALEWAYIPALEILMHFLMIILPFTYPLFYEKRARLIGIVLIRVPIFALMAWVSVKAWLLYLLAYCIMLTALRFADAFQHTYDVFLVQDLAQADGKIADGRFSDGKLRDRAYEQANTFSNLASFQYPWLNILFLNFPYHNAHHERPIVEWHALPKLHQQIFGDSELLPVIPMVKLLKTYHRHRLTRLQSDDYGVVNNQTADGFIGAAGVSFLTAL